MTSVQGPPPSVIVSTVPASVATTTEERVLDMLFLESPSLLPLQRGCWRRRGHVLQACGDARAAAEVGQPAGGTW